MGTARDDRRSARRRRCAEERATRSAPSSLQRRSDCADRAGRRRLGTVIFRLRRASPRGDRRAPALFRVTRICRPPRSVRQYGDARTVTGRASRTDDLTMAGRINANQCSRDRRCWCCISTSAVFRRGGGRDSPERQPAPSWYSSRAAHAVGARLQQAALIFDTRGDELPTINRRHFSSAPPHGR